MWHRKVTTCSLFSSFLGTIKLDRFITAFADFPRRLLEPVGPGGVVGGPGTGGRGRRPQALQIFLIL